MVTLSFMYPQYNVTTPSLFSYPCIMAFVTASETAVANANERVLKIFQMAGMQKIIPQYTSITEALKAMGGVENAV